jgi:transcription elongation factor Elf1
MMKANGRIKKASAASRKNTKKNKGKDFVCVECGAAEHVDTVEFGEVVICNICGQKMVEA